MEKIRYFSMFSGIGGFEYGIQRANKSMGWLQQPNEERQHSQDFKEQRGMPYKWECVGFSEIDKYAIATYLTHFPDHKNFGDATKINTEELPDFDLLCGGFPCQSFSIAGKREGFKDTRGTMFFEIERILKAKRPKLVLLENVKGLLNHAKGETFKIILQTLSELRYDVQWMVLNSKFFGVPQNRERVFIIGSIRGQSRPEILPFREDVPEDNNKGPVVKTLTAGSHSGGKHSNMTGIEIVHCLDVGYNKLEYDQRKSRRSLIFEERSVIHNVYGGFGEGIRESENTCPTIRTPKGGGHLPMILSPHPRSGDPKKGGTGTLSSENHSFSLDHIPLFVKETKEKKIMDLYNHTESSEVCPTLKDPCHNDRRVKEGSKIRRLTPTECARLQGFPDDWHKVEFNGKLLSDSQAYKQYGNEVTTNVIKAIIERLL